MQVQWQLRWMLVIATALSMSCAIRRSQSPVQGEVVKSIQFRGNSGLLGGIPDSALRSAMEQSQSPGGWWLNPSEEAITLNRGALNKDAWRIETWYAHNGYFDARVTGWDVITLKKGNPKQNRPPVVKVIGYVEQGEPSIVKSISWDDMDAVGGALLTLLRKKAALQEGDDFTLDALRETEGQTLNQLHELSFGFATIRSRVEASPEDHTVDVHLIADKGPSSRFGEVTVEGKYGIPEELVMDEVTITKGKAFRASTLSETQRKLFGLGVFSVVNVVPDLSKPEEKVIPVQLELSETRYRQLRVGGGVELESGKQDVHAVAEFMHLNVFNRLWDVKAAVRPGYAWLATLGDITDEEAETKSSPTGQAELTLGIPRFPAKGFRLLNRFDVEYDLEEGYEYLSPSAGPFLSWQVNRSLTLGLGYDIKFFKYFDLEAAGQLGSNRFGLNFTNPYVLSRLSQQVIWNTRDNALFPSTGEYIVTDIREAGGPFGGGFNYLDVRTDARVFRRIRKLIFFRPNITIGTRVGAGVLQPFEFGDAQDEVPFAERVMLGGSNTVRGWTRNHLGPYICDADQYTGDLNLDEPASAAACAGRFGRSQETTEIQPIGGTAFLHGSFEIRKYVLAGYGVVLFNDWGMVWNELSDVSVANLLPSAGIGLRYKSPIGAIRLDGAYRFNLEPMFDQEPALQVHFGLSEAF